MDTLHAGNRRLIQRIPKELGQADSENLRSGPLTCSKGQGKMRILTFIEDEEVIEKILMHLGL
jgi:hypothetical protein